jgi:hypothetical protein
MKNLLPPPLDRQAEVIGPQDAAITKFARLAACGELHEPGAGGDIDGESDTFLATDHVTVACCYVPYAPGYALLYLFYPVATLSVWQAAGHQLCALGYAAEF